MLISNSLIFLLVIKYYDSNSYLISETMYMGKIVHVLESVVIPNRTCTTAHFESRSQIELRRRKSRNIRSIHNSVHGLHFVLFHLLVLVLFSPIHLTMDLGGILVWPSDFRSNFTYYTRKKESEKKELYKRFIGTTLESLCTRERIFVCMFPVICHDTSTLTKKDL